jgi:DNA-directed RNA polymerase specialized sigma24 family protein
MRESIMAQRGRFQFETTRWSVVLAAGGSHSSAARDALAALCDAYWYPLYGYVRRHGYDADDAADAVQSFILLLLERDDLHGLRPERGRFRAFLLASLRHFLGNRRVHDRALKRGGGAPSLPLAFEAAEQRYLHEPAVEGTPETVFDRNWALAVLDHVFARIRQEWDATGRGMEFGRLKGCLMGDLPEGGYRSLALDLASTDAAVKMAVHRLKRRFEQELRREIADTVTDEAVDDELRYLLKALQG